MKTKTRYTSKAEKATTNKFGHNKKIFAWHKNCFDAHKMAASKQNPLVRNPVAFGGKKPKTFAFRMFVVIV